MSSPHLQPVPAFGRLEAVKDESFDYVKRQPLKAIAIAAGVGPIVGMAAGLDYRPVTNGSARIEAPDAFKSPALISSPRQAVTAATPAQPSDG
jgi:hypothetical protein